MSRVEAGAGGRPHLSLPGVPARADLDTANDLQDSWGVGLVECRECMGLYAPDETVMHRRPWGLICDHCDRYGCAA